MHVLCVECSVSCSYLYLFLAAIRARNSTRKILSMHDLAAFEHYKECE